MYLAPQSIRSAIVLTIGNKVVSVAEDTHHVEVAVIASLSRPGVQRTVVSSHLLPGTVQVVGHQVDEVHVPETVSCISTE